ncbi:hypothetical protein P20652_0933 [Pseudoalteromonas sp. BSi20652]|nr:hypothetical protein P20652_0933 [Pseudoalteromonas sp. BSi20652]
MLIRFELIKKVSLDANGPIQLNRGSRSVFLAIEIMPE